MLAYVFLLLATIADRERRVLSHVQALAREAGTGLPLRIYADGDRIERVITTEAFEQVRAEFYDVCRHSFPSTIDPDEAPDWFVSDWIDVLQNHILIYRGRDTDDATPRALMVLFINTDGGQNKETPGVDLFLRSRSDREGGIYSVTKEKILRRTIALLEDTGNGSWYDGYEGPRIRLPDDALDGRMPRNAFFPLIDVPLIEPKAKEAIAMMVTLLKGQGTSEGWTEFWKFLDTVKSEDTYSLNLLKTTLERCLEINGMIGDLKEKEAWSGKLYGVKSFDDPLWLKFAEETGLFAEETWFDDSEAGENGNGPAEIAQHEFERALEDAHNLWTIIDSDISTFDRHLPNASETTKNDRDGTRKVTLRINSEDTEDSGIEIRVGVSSNYDWEPSYNLPKYKHPNLSAGILPLLESAGLLVTPEVLKKTTPADAPVFDLPIPPPDALDYLKGERRSTLIEPRHRLVRFLLGQHPWLLSREETELAKEP